VADLEVLIPRGYAVSRIAWSHRFFGYPQRRRPQVEEGEGLREFLRPSGYTGSAPFTGREPGSNGLTWDAERRLVLCQHGARRIARLDAPGRFTTLVDRYEGKRLNSPNDLVSRPTAICISPTRRTGFRGRSPIPAASLISRAFTALAPTARSRC
jgi:gluconolactonase